MDTTKERETHASSTGQDMTGAEWLDAHFECARPQYEAQVRMAGIQRGWHVLDAACGSGSFLPWLADLVGPSGQLAALDLASDNLALVERRVAGWALPCPVACRIGTVLELPYPDDSFDAVWFSNTSQYQTDAELERTLAEFRRVVRPGGLVALKESDVTMYRVYSGPPGVALRWFQARARTGNAQAAGCLRAPELPRWLRRTGLLNVWQRSTLIDLTAPLSPAARANQSGFWSYAAAIAPELGLPPADQDFWATLHDPVALQRYLDDPDYWFAECNVLAVGTVPGSRSAPL